MNGLKGKNVLLVTPLDFARMPNNSEHNRVEHYVRLGCRVTVLYKTSNQSLRFRDLLRDTCTFRLRCHEVSGARLVAVDPYFNYFGGILRNAEASATRTGKRLSARLLIARLLSPLAVLRDVAFLPCFLLAASMKLKERFDVCLGVGPWGGLVGWALKKLGRVRLLVYVDRDYEAGLVPDRLRRSYTERVECFGIRQADLTVCVGQLLKERRGGRNGVEIHVIPNGVDWDRFVTSRNRQKKGQTLIYVGNVISWSGVETAIRALPLIRREFPRICVDVVGSGLPAYMDYLHDLVARLGVGAQVRFLGQRPREELDGLLAQADIGLENSKPVLFRRYACPIKVMEYMAAGLPVIATESTEAGDLVTRYGCGVAVSYDVEHFASAAISLLGEPRLYEVLRESGIEQSRTMTWTKLLNREADLILAKWSSQSTAG